MKTATPAIWVRDFAKVPAGSSLLGNEENKDGKSGQSIKLPLDIETISLSSEDEATPLIPKQTPKRAIRTPNPKATKPQSVLSSVKKGRTPRTPKLPSQYKFRPLNDYFQATKRDQVIGLKASESKLSTSTYLNGNATKDTENKEISDVQQCKSNLRQVKVVLRRLSIDQIVDITRKRKPPDGQTKLPEFIEYKSSDDTYFRVYGDSTIAGTTSGQLASTNSNLLKAEPKPESDSMTPFQCEDDTPSNAYGDDACNINEDSDATIKEEAKDQFDCDPGVQTKNQKNRKPPAKKTIKKPAKLVKISKALAPTKSVATKKPKIECPHYKIVEGTKLAVDAFRYGDIEGVEHYFLSHFHADHYIGLKKSFNHTLHVSNITARLVIQFIKVDERYIRCIDINTPVVVDGIEVTALDANHCPGAVMFLFKWATGKCVLHTGDFRASAEMEEYPEFWNNDIETIYLDTTYLSSRYEFHTQSDSIDLILQYCHEFVNISTSSARKPLIICGAYKIGKEKVWLRIAQEFGYKAWIDPERRKAMQCIQNDEIFEVLTQFAKDGSIHVLPLGHISYQYIVEYVAKFGDNFQKVLAIRPSGWERQKSKPNFANRISILGVQYSEHSSYNELERFVRFLRPKYVHSTVPINGKNLAKTPSIPKAWFNQNIQPRTRSYQRNIKDFMVKKSPPNNNEDEAVPPAELTQKSYGITEPQQIVECIIDDESDDYMA